MKIAIQGHNTRGKDVIKIFESIGGINKLRFNGGNSYAYYYIDENNYIDKELDINTQKYKLYTLEEFEKEFPFKIGDSVVFKNAINNSRIYIISELTCRNDHFVYKLKDLPHYYYSPLVLKLYIPMKERNITLTLDKAKEWYNKGGELREIALQAFTKEELSPLPKSWEEYCKMHPIMPENYVFSPCCPKKYIALWKLEQLRDCYRQGWKPKSKKEAYVIKHADRGLSVYCYHSQEFLSFQPKEVAEEFLQNFEPLIREAGDLI